MAKKRRRPRWKRPKKKLTAEQLAKVREGGKHKYTREQHLTVHRAYCRAQLLNLPLFETCKEAFEQAFGEELPRSLFSYCAYHENSQDEREAHLKEALLDPTLTAVVNPAYAARTLSRAIEIALTPRLSRIETARVRRDGEWEDVVVEVQSIEPATAIRGVAELRNWMPYVHRVLPDGEGPALIGVGKGHQQKQIEGQGRFGMAQPMGSGPGDDLEGFELPREMAEQIIAEENEEFERPVEDLAWMSLEDHEKMMQEWEKGVPPPHAGMRPTRRIMKDGSIEVYAADDELPKGSEDVPGVIDEDLKKIIDAADDEVGRTEDDDD